MDEREKEARQALTDLERYLADEIAPIMAVDAVRLVAKLPPEFSAAAVRSWLESQLRGPHPAPVSHYLYHAVKKIHLLVEFKLVESREVGEFLAGLSRILLEACPAAERDDLKVRLSRIGESETTLSAPVHLLQREIGSEEEERILEEAKKEVETAREEGKEAPAEPNVTPRFDQLVRRLEKLRIEKDAAAATRAAQQDVVTQLLTSAAIESRDSAQFGDLLENLKGHGIDPGFNKIFRMLGESLPGWELDVPEDAVAALPDQARALRAMHKIIEMAESAEEGGERFSQLVYAAIEQFNDGHLAQAVSMFDLADRLHGEKKVDTEVASLVRQRAQGTVSLDALRRFSTQESKHGLLRRVLSFFPAFDPAGLLDRLHAEEKRNARRLILALLEVYGSQARQPVLEKLQTCLSGDLPDPEGFFTRNLVHLLRRLPGSRRTQEGFELRVLAMLVQAGRPAIVVREAMGALGEAGTAASEKVLVDRLGSLERDAAENDGVPYGLEETQKLLDRTCAALGRIGTRNATRAVVRHAFGTEPSWGDTMARLDHLSGCDMSSDAEQLDSLLQSVRNLLPTKVLGVVVRKNVDDVIHLLRSISGTRDEMVTVMAKDIAARFRGQDFADVASGILEAQQRMVPAEEEVDRGGMTGDVELFGLPNLLQNLGESAASGRLRIEDRRGRERATILFDQGRIAGASSGRLDGLDAVYHLFERPVPGTFRFEQDDQVTRSLDDDAPPPEEVLPVMLEGVRRYDEFQEARAIVPDGAQYRAGTLQPTIPSDEDNQEFVLSVWRRVSSGTAPETVETAVRSDAFRVRRLMVHWVEEGALELRSE